MEEKRSFLIFSLFLFCNVLYANIAVTPTFVPRSQGRDKMRTMVGTLAWGHTDLCNMDCWYGDFSIGVGYAQSFRNDKISRCLFGCDIDCGECKDTILVQGSDVENRNCKAWLADYFYLNCDYDGSFQFRPKIQNVFIDLDFYWGMDALARGLYLRAYGPIVWTKWQTNFCVNDPVSTSTSSCAEGYFTPFGSETLLTSLADYFCGSAPQTTENVIFCPLRFAKMPGCDETKTSFAELRIELGWNAVQTDHSHFGFNAQIAVPTGNRRDAEFVFSPVVGNGRHWEAGGGISAHYNFTMSEDNEKHSGIYTDLSITHVFLANEDRTFDICGKPNSRYMLAERLGRPIVNNLTASSSPDTSLPLGVSVRCPQAQFKNEFKPVANLTTTLIRIDNAVQIDWVTLINVSRRGFSFDIGYNLWVRTCEGISGRRGCKECDFNPTLFDTSQQQDWALKGDAHVFGYASDTSGGLTINQPVALSATESIASIHSGTNALVPNAIAQQADLRNLGVDNARFAYAGSNNQRLLAGTDFPNDEASHIKTSLDPIFLSFDNIELQPTRGLSHKVFTHLGYTWDRPRIVPFLGFGAFAEIGSNTERVVPPQIEEGTFVDACAAECFDCSLTQWAVWIKGGFSFG